MTCMDRNSMAVACARPGEWAGLAPSRKDEK